MNPIAPINWVYDISQTTGFIVAGIIGVILGFLLERGGFGNSRKLAMQFYLGDFTVYKTMFTAVIVAMTGLLILRIAGLFDFDGLSINSSYIWPGIVGGVLMGIGFVFGGYCPGTSAVGLATFKKDALFYVLGLLCGLGFFGEIEQSVHGFMSSSYLGDYMTLPVYFHVSPALVTWIIMAAGLLSFLVIEKAEKRNGDLTFLLGRSKEKGR